MRITEDSKGKLIETIWQLNARFQSGEDEALQLMFDAVSQFAREAAADERDRLDFRLIESEYNADYDPRGCRVFLALLGCFWLAVGALVWEWLA